MFTIDRIRRLCEHYNIWVPKSPHGELHELLNALDDAARMDTTWLPGHDGCCVCNIYRIPKCRRYVGARVALHEQALAQEDNAEIDTYFWLGQEAEARTA